MYKRFKKTYQQVSKDTKSASKKCTKDTKSASKKCTKVQKKGVVPKKTKVQLKKERDTYAIALYRASKKATVLSKHTSLKDKKIKALQEHIDILKDINATTRVLDALKGVLVGGCLAYIGGLIGYYLG